MRSARVCPVARLVTKHATKQVDRLLSNPGINVDAGALGALHRGPATSIVVAMDWTDFDADSKPPSCCR